jgi:hypothetical protein
VQNETSHFAPPWRCKDTADDRTADRTAAYVGSTDFLRAVTFFQNSGLRRAINARKRRFFLSHHAIKKTDSTSNLREVVDESTASSTGLSINDHRRRRVEAESLAGPARLENRFHKRRSAGNASADAPMSTPIQPSNWTAKRRLGRHCRSYQHDSRRMFHLMTCAHLRPDTSHLSGHPPGRGWYNSTDPQRQPPACLTGQFIPVRKKSCVWSPSTPPKPF